MKTAIYSTTLLAIAASQAIASPSKNHVMNCNLQISHEKISDPNFFEFTWPKGWGDLSGEPTHVFFMENGTAPKSEIKRINSNTAGFEFDVELVRDENNKIARGRMTAIRNGNIRVPYGFNSYLKNESLLAQRIIADDIYTATLNCWSPEWRVQH